MNKLTSLEKIQMVFEELEEKYFTWCNEYKKQSKDDMMTHSRQIGIVDNLREQINYNLTLEESQTLAKSEEPFNDFVNFMSGMENGYIDKSVVLDFIEEVELKLSFTDKLDNKIIRVGGYFVAQQISFNVWTLLESDFDKKEVEFLSNNGVEYVQRLIENKYKPYEDLTETEKNAIRVALNSYESYGLINDWQAGICDYEYDEIILNYMDNKRKNNNGELQFNELYDRLFLTVLKID